MNMNVNQYEIFEHPANIKLAEQCIDHWFSTIKK
jgi:hypothetical protein